MKKIGFLTFLCFLLCQLQGIAQGTQQQLELSPRKTTSLIFPFAIRSVDRGSPEVLAQVPRHVENVLHLKAAREGFGPTNLTVITSDGRLYHFPVRYAANPETTLIKMNHYPETGVSVQFPDARPNDEQLRNITEELTRDVRFYYGIKARAGGARATLEGIYTLGNTLFFRLVVANNSPIPYDIDFIRFSTRDRKQAKRAASQEEEIHPLYIGGYDEKTVAAGQQKVLVFALPKFTIARHKVQLIELFERNGARHLTLRVRSRDIMQACPLMFD